jgi:uncharacterized protein YcfJ
MAWRSQEKVLLVKETFVMLRLGIVLLAAMSFGCAATLTEVVRSGEMERVRVAKVSLMRKGPYKATVKLPTEHGDASVNIKGNDEAMSGNLAMTGAAIGAAVGGPTGAAAGGVAGAIGDWTKDKIGISPKNFPDGKEILGTELFTPTPPDLP